MRPEPQTPVACFAGSPEAFRLCTKDDAPELVSAELRSADGKTPGIVRLRRNARCAYFETPPGTLDGPTSVTFEQRDAGGAVHPAIIPLTGADRRWVAPTPFDVATRLLLEVPLERGYEDLFEAHSALRYRLAPGLRLGAAFEARLGKGTGMFGGGPALASSMALGARWVVNLDAEYSFDKIGYGRKRWDTAWAHGPAAVLALGYAEPRFLGSPSIVESGTVGPLVKAEYLFVPGQHDAFWVVSAGAFVRYGL